MVMMVQSLQSGCMSMATSSSFLMPSPRMALSRKNRPHQRICMRTNRSMVAVHAGHLELSELTAVGPLDGRYGSKVGGLKSIFSEYGLIRFRVAVECRWLQHLSTIPQVEEVPALGEDASALLDALATDFTVEDAKLVKNVERTTNHDVKAVEYVLKEKISANDELKRILEFVHFACTSEDVNNLSHALMLKEAMESEILPVMDQVIESISRCVLFAFFGVERTWGQ